MPVLAEMEREIKLIDSLLIINLSKGWTSAGTTLVQGLRRRISIVPALFQRGRLVSRCNQLVLILISRLLAFFLWTLKLWNYIQQHLQFGVSGWRGKGLVDLVNQLTLERCHSFWFYGSCRKRIPIRDSSMPKRILSQCGVSSKMFIGLIVPTTCSSVRWD